ncbi:hypothetical protein CYANOKiyG1_76680 [Okeania sp. KiyG1]|nr:hypothetical protein CYANOKiyG1_76680 [Okeania sp. KiyG1]
MTNFTFLNFLIRFFSGFGASIFVPSLNVAKVLIPKSIPTELSVLGKISGCISTTKLKKYLCRGERPFAPTSLITVTDDGAAGNSLDHTIFSFPIFAK